jgi:hypothetical protein
VHSCEFSLTAIQMAWGARKMAEAVKDLGLSRLVATRTVVLLTLLIRE